MLQRQGTGTGELNMRNLKGRVFQRGFWAGPGFVAAAALVAMSCVGTAAHGADFGTKYDRGDNGLSQDYDAYDTPRRHPRFAKRRDHIDDGFDHETYRAPHDAYAYRDRNLDRQGYGSLKDDYAGREFSDHAYDDGWQNTHRCLSQRRIRRQLRRAGWRGFRNGRVRGNVGYIEARKRRTGEVYELAVDRCTGAVISAACIGEADRRWRRRGVNFDDYRDDVVVRW